MRWQHLSIYLHIAIDFHSVSIILGLSSIIEIFKSQKSKGSSLTASSIVHNVAFLEYLVKWYSMRKLYSKWWKCVYLNLSISFENPSEFILVSFVIEIENCQSVWLLVTTFWVILGKIFQVFSQIDLDLKIISIPFIVALGWAAIARAVTTATTWSVATFAWSIARMASVSRSWWSRSFWSTLRSKRNWDYDRKRF